MLITFSEIRRQLRTLPLATLGVWALALSTASSSDAPPPVEPGGAAASTQSSADITPSALLDDLDATARAKQLRMERLRRQLQQLGEASRRVAETHPSPTVPQPPEPDPPHAEPEVINPPVADVHAVPPPVDIDAHPHEPPADLHAPPAHHEPHATPAVDAHSPHGAADGEVLTGAQINRLALADSLFATDQSDLALQAYTTIELSKQSAADRYWIEYQVANCHRRLGNLPEAEQRYRRLAGLVDGGWCATHARWWLDAMATKASLERDLGQIKLTLKTIEEQLDAKPAQ